jgi:hypothetical protein
MLAARAGAATTQIKRARGSPKSAFPRRTTAAVEGARGEACRVLSAPASCDNAARFLAKKN